MQLNKKSTPRALPYGAYNEEGEESLRRHHISFSAMGSEKENVTVFSDPFSAHILPL